MRYEWQHITADFDRSLPILRVRCDCSISTSMGSQDGVFSESPNKNCDGKSLNDVKGAEWGYAFDNRFNFYNKYFSNRYYNFTDEKWTAQTHTTKVEGTENTYEFICPLTYYWGGMMDVNDYNKLSGYTVYVQVSSFGSSKSSFKFSSTGGTDTFEIDADTGWTATTTSTFVHLNQTTGTTGGTLTLTCDENSGSARTATITFTNDDEETFDITISQKARGIIVPIAKMKKSGKTISKEYYYGH